MPEANSDNGFFGDFVQGALSGLGLQDGATAAKTLGGVIKTAGQSAAPAQPPAPPPAPTLGISLPKVQGGTTQLMVVGLAAAVLVYLMVRK
jgi:hypothetical protein